MKADEIRNMENNNADMEYITLPTTGIFTNMQADQTANYASCNEYQCQESSYGQNHVNNSNGQFGYPDYSASPNSCSCCCGYDIKGNNNSEPVNVATAQNNQHYGQVEYQYEYAEQSNVAQYYNMNRCAGGMENFATNSPTPPMAYQASNENNIGNFTCNIEPEAQSNYFTMPAPENIGMNSKYVNYEFWSSFQNPENYADDNIQSQSVYSSDFQPFHGKGNNFNHFPNNNFMDMKMFGDMIHSSSCQSTSPECSYQLGDPTYDMDDSQNVGSIQMQGYPMSNTNYMQMCST
ncbi:homeobox protein 2 [Drosophila innubila]|uniref:homeobox protein 2 n=1 Tax=Drosophila innubila TaxID=198719 RepID=UPI00148C6DA0|nr:homeobox protein 2 [Drosophila innubila]